MRFTSPIYKRCQFGKGRNLFGIREKKGLLRTKELAVVQEGIRSGGHSHVEPGSRNELENYV